MRLPSIRRLVVQRERSVSLNFRMKYILFFAIVVLTLQLTTAKKIKCFDVTNDPTTVTKTTTKCPRVTCRNLYIWSETLCKCICPQIHCPDGYTLGNDCDCLPITTTTTVSTTTTTECPFRATCPNRYEWSEDDCDCVCPPMYYCPKGSSPGGDCDCIPDTTPGTTVCPEQECRNRYVWREDICACDCPPLWCPEGTIYDYTDCNCIPESTTETTETTPDTTLCPEQECRNRYVWLQEMCECVCPPMYCEEGTVHGGDCDCIPDTTIETIDPTGSTPIYCPEYCNVEYDSNGAPYCQCDWGCDYIIECPEGQKWDFDVCGCVDDPDYVSTSPETTLPDCGKIACENGFLDPNTCECIPYETSPTATTKDCRERPCKLGSFWYGDPVCDCFVKCLYSKPCPMGKIWDWYFCNCRNDTDYVPSPTTEEETSPTDDVTLTIEWETTEEGISPFTDFHTNGTDPCDPCKCPKGNTIGSPDSCVCAKNQDKLKTTKGKACCWTNKSQKENTWPEKCVGKLTIENAWRFKCDKTVEKGCGQCPDGNYQFLPKSPNNEDACCCEHHP